MALFRKTTVETIIEPIGGIVNQLHAHAARNHYHADAHDKFAAKAKERADKHRTEAVRATHRAEHYTKLFNL